MPDFSTMTPTSAAAAAAAAALSSLMPMSTLMGPNFNFSTALQQLTTPSTAALVSMCSPATSVIAGGTHTPTSSIARQSSNASSHAAAHNDSNGSGGGTTPTLGSQSNTARSRLMFDPLSELPILEKWFEENPHPGWLQIEQYTEALNSLAYRQSYPPISVSTRSSSDRTYRTPYRTDCPYCAAYRTIPYRVRYGP